MREEIIKVICIGCEKETTPETIDMQLWRIGINLHADPECIAKADKKYIPFGGISGNELLRIGQDASKGIQPATGYSDYIRDQALDYEDD